MARVAVVGGGITGLAAAYDLARAGVSVTVLDRAERLGGKVRTDDVDGFLVESGPDSFITYRPAALDLASELGLVDQVIAPTEPRVVYLRRNERMVPLPDGMGLALPTRLLPFVTTSLFTWPQKARAGLDLLLPRWLGPEDASIGAFLEHRLGRAMVTGLADPLIGGIYGASVHDLSIDSVLPQFREYEREHRSLLLAGLAQGRAARRRASAAGAPGQGSPFRSLRGGMGTLVEALERDVRERPGVEVLAGCAVAGLGSTGGISTLTLGNDTRLTADVVILAADAATTAGLLKPDLPEAAALLGQVRLGSSTVVTLGYDAAAFRTPPPGHGFLEAGPRPADVSAVTVSSAKWAGRAPEGRVLLRAFLPERSTALTRRPDAVVLATVARQVADILDIAGEPTLGRVDRWERSMPLYTVGHADRMASLRDHLRRRPSWLLAGASYDGVGLPDCVSSGRRAAGVALSLLDGVGSGDRQPRSAR